MKQSLFKYLVLGLILSNSATLYAKTILPTPNGIQLPVGYDKWQIIGVSHRTDNNSLRIIVGNNIAINAAHTGKTNPWPQGTILGKLVWKDKQHPDWKMATVPGNLSHIEFMVKDMTKYRQTGGWGYARWVGMKAIPYGKDANVAHECFSCHTHVKNTDYVFTRPVQLPLNH